jgi:GH15 family glucan-1,4-alpha-glucosidase
LRHFQTLYFLLEKKRQGERLVPEMFFHTRYTVSGEEGTEPWGNFQLDGYGTYLWGVAEHLKRTNDQALLAEIERSLDATVTYLTEFWGEKNFDCWEEGGDQVHPSTLAAIYGGLQAIFAFLPDPRIKPVCAAIKAYVERYGVENGRFTKSVSNKAVDANLLWLCVPFAMVKPDDVRMMRTVEAIEAKLCTGGVHRYPGDAFYGGGAWILLTAWLGWYYVKAGNLARAKELLAWCEAQTDEQGNLPEQVPEGLFVPEARQEWLDRWGEPAKPLLWSHAMYVVVKREVMLN